MKRLMIPMLALGMAAGTASALVVTEVEGNDGLAAAMNIDSFFDLSHSPDIGDVVGNTSESIPHVTIVSLPGDATPDCYSFSVSAGDTVGWFDIDYGFWNADGTGPDDMDAEITLYSAAGDWLDFDEDSFIEWGAGGSDSTLDPLIGFDFVTPGTYVICVTSHGYDHVVVDGEYTLQVSIEGHSTVPDGGMTLALLSIGLLGLLGLERRK